MRRAQGLVAFAVFAMAVGLLVWVVGVWMAICRYCCCCWGGRSGNCKCGSAFPTRKTRLLGYSNSPITGLSYPPVAVLVAQVLVCFLVTFLG